ncbi:hypothetical protein BDM02DRAFT_3122255 [Thelephora ganbajun]|uniref:Uncharacterized protein n=1 Tax=Thelephora ganbajun TaxID=370292 RepID=A0ACB6Z4X4_THEGA|nr:hypothetical protein BDM02DRAFT_3122255 [Thelephora ganbajun]
MSTPRGRSYRERICGYLYPLRTIPVTHQLYYRSPPKSDPDGGVLQHAADVVVCDRFLRPH